MILSSVVGTVTRSQAGRSEVRIVMGAEISKNVQSISGDDPAYSLIHNGVLSRK